MTKLLQKAFDEAAKLPEKNQDALGSLLLDEIEVERRREDQISGMPWPEIRERYPHQWLLLEATEAHSSGGQRILESLTVLETCPDGLSAMRRYGEIHGQDPYRELYVLHTDRETVEIEEVHWAGIRLALGDIQVQDFPIQIGAMKYGFPLQGLLGTDFFVQARVVLDLGLFEVYPSSSGRNRM